MAKSAFALLALSFALQSVPIPAQNSDAVPGAAPALPLASSQARITGVIDESSLTTLGGNTHPLAQPRYDQGPAPASMAASRLILVLARSTQQEADLQTYLESVQDASSPNFRHFLSPEEFGSRFGVGDADLQSIQSWLAGHGFTVNKISKGRMAIEFSGTVGRVEEAFHTSIHSYLVNGEQHWANAADPQIPSALTPVVAGVASLNSFKPKAQYKRGPSGAFDAQKHTVTPSYTIGDLTDGYYIFLGPADAATIYNTPTSLNANLSGTAYTGTGATIGIVGDSNIDLTQNANYRTTFGLSQNHTTVVIDGADPGENGDAIEAYLDTQVSGGIAPSASVILYIAADTSYQAGIVLAIQRALDENQADILSLSFSSCESSLEASGNQFVQELWEQAAAQGISVTVAAGDNGPAGCDNFNTENVANGGFAVNGLASTPYNMALGGTDYDILLNDFTSYVDVSNTLPGHRSALSYIPEEPWNDSTYPNTDIAANEPLSAYQGYTSSDDDIAAGSGGISTVYPVPAWQASVASGNGRNLPDVSFLAGNGFYGALWGLCTDLDEDSNGNPISDCVPPTTGNNFNLTGIGGTSAAAPAFAGMLALLKQKTGSRLGQADYVLYHLAKTDYSAVFHDVTGGDNSVNCQAGSPNCSLNAAGYDFMSGYNAAIGYDLASGLGSVNASQLAADWASVSLAATSTSLELNGATSALKITHGESVTVKASVSSASGTPSGDVALVDSLSPATRPNSEGIAYFTLSGGTGSGTTTFLPGGSYQVSAHYGGGSAYAQSDSNAIPVTVGAESSTTSLTVVGYYDPETGYPATAPYYGSAFLIDAQPYGDSATAANPNGVATGTITFKNGASTLGTAALSAEGVAELQTALLPGGKDSLTAVFPGDSSFKANTSSPVAFAVTPAPTLLYSLSGSPVVNVGSPVTFTMVFVDNSGNFILDSLGAAPTGTVTFMNGTTTLGSSPVTGTAGTFGTSYTYATGATTFTTSALPGGFDYITAIYDGDANYAASPASSSVQVYVTGDAGITFSPSAPTIVVNQPLSMTVSVATISPFAAPTGTITLSSGTYTSSAVKLTAGSASFTIPANSLAVGTDTLTATYSGDTNYSAGNNSATVTVTPAPGFGIFGITTINVTPGATTGNTETLRVNPAGGFTGTVSLSCAISPTAASNPATCSLSPASVAITGASAQTSTLTISTTAASSGCPSANLRQKGVPWYAAGSAALACVLLFGIPARRRRWMARLGMLALLVALAGGVLACGGTGAGSGGCTASNNPGTTAGNYAITVTGTSGSTTATGTISLFVE